MSNVTKPAQTTRSARKGGIERKHRRRSIESSQPAHHTESNAGRVDAFDKPTPDALLTTNILKGLRTAVTGPTRETAYAQALEFLRSQNLPLSTLMLQASRFYYFMGTQPGSPSNGVWAVPASYGFRACLELIAEGKATCDSEFTNRIDWVVRGRYDLSRAARAKAFDLIVRDCRALLLRDGEITS